MLPGGWAGPGAKRSIGSKGGPVSQTFSSKFLSKGGGGGFFGHKFLTQILPFIFAYVSGKAAQAIEQHIAPGYETAFIQYI
jgi:hypothetical protein